MPTSRTESGFTLLELLIVLSILVIVSGLIIPNLSITDNSAFNADVRRAASVLTYARRMAIVKGAPQSARFAALDPEASDYEERRAAFDTLAADSARWFSEELQLSYQGELDPEPAVVDEISVSFFPQGGSTGGLLGFSRGERSALIRIDAITGRIDLAYNGEELDEAQ